MAGAALGSDGKALAGMGIACADLAGKGRPDLYVTNFYQEPNTLYLNQGGRMFLDATAAAGLLTPSLPVLGFGTQAIDLQLSGWPDLVVANGHVDDLRQRGIPWKMPPQVFANRGDGRFTDVSSACGAFFQGAYLGRGMARLDYDRDGRSDLVIVHQDRPVALLRNETEPFGHRLVLDLVGLLSNRNGLGTRVWVTAGGRTQRHELCGGDGFLASNERRLIIGLGQAAHAERVEVRWPSGRIDQWPRLPADRLWLLREGSPPVAAQGPSLRTPAPGGLQSAGRAERMNPSGVQSLRSPGLVPVSKRRKVAVGEKTAQPAKGQ